LEKEKKRGKFDGFRLTRVFLCCGSNHHGGAGGKGGDYSVVDLVVAEHVLISTTKEKKETQFLEIWRFGVSILVIRGTKKGKAKT